MTEEEKKYIDDIAGKFPDSFIKTEEFKGDLSIIIKKDDIFEIMKYLKESKDTVFDFLVDITAVDYLKIGGDERYAIVYHLLSMSYYRRLRVKALVPEEDLNIPSMMPLWQTANWQEREIEEMFGIKFTGHPNPRKLLLPDDYQGFPLRKDYPVAGEGYRSDFTNLKEE
ncbi:NADH-quinone oxidoreductase subunit C [candidate division KSB1 bacterium]